MVERKREVLKCNKSYPIVKTKKLLKTRKRLERKKDRDSEGERNKIWCVQQKKT